MQDLPSAEVSPLPCGASPPLRDGASPPLRDGVSPPSHGQLQVESLKLIADPVTQSTFLKRKARNPNYENYAFLVLFLDSLGPCKTSLLRKCLLFLAELLLLFEMKLLLLVAAGSILKNSGFSWGSWVNVFDQRNDTMRK